MCDFADVDRKGNMKKLSGAKVAFVMFSAMTVACVSGSIGGTLAWYAYSTRALVSYSGTSVNETALLQVGICSDINLNSLMPDSVSKVKYPGDDNYYYFSNTGKGLTYDIIEVYLSQKKFATDELEPTTSGSYTSGLDESAFSLKRSPNEIAYGNTTPAYIGSYLTIPLVFRIEAGEEGTYLGGKELWLSKAIARASSAGDGDVYKAIRVFVDRDARNYSNWKSVSVSYTIGSIDPVGDLGYAYYLKEDGENHDYDLYLYDSENTEWNLLENDIVSKATAPDFNQYSKGHYLNTTDNKLYVKTSKDFIFNPSAASKGRTRVGGVMNISRDDYYDFDGNGEILFGEYDPAALNLISNAPFNGEEAVADVNGVGDLTPSTFVAKHKNNTKYYSNLDSHDELFGHAEYESISSIAPKRDSRDYLSNYDEDHPTSVCTTREDDNYLGRVNLTVYLEGWDFSVVDKEISHGFDLGLTFEMSRL